MVYGPNTWQGPLTECKGLIMDHGELPNKTSLSSSFFLEEYTIVWFRWPEANWFPARQRKADRPRAHQCSDGSRNFCRVWHVHGAHLHRSVYIYFIDFFTATVTVNEKWIKVIADTTSNMTTSIHFLIPCVVALLFNQEEDNKRNKELVKSDNLFSFFEIFFFL